jgi:hypothetical protein
MKKLILVLAALVAQMAMAGEKLILKSTITPEQFLREVKEMNFENGQLDGLGGNCSLVVEQNEGKRYLTFVIAHGMTFSVPVEDSEKVEVKKNQILDGSGVTTYKFGPIHQLKRLHVDDAYDTLTLKYGDTSLRCGIYY